MIFSDDNKQLAVTDSTLCVLRRNSAFSYTLDGFAREPASPMHGIVRSLNGRIYEFLNGAIVSHHAGESREFGVGPVLDFHRSGAEFYFVKNKINNKLVVDGSDDAIA